MYVGPVCPPGNKEMIHKKYVEWVQEIDPDVEIKSPV
jgi:hypothetical protein